MYFKQGKCGIHIRARMAIVLVLCSTVFSIGTVLAGPKGAVGDLYVADYGNSRIMQVDYITGVVSDFITTGIKKPADICFGPNGNLFVANLGVVTEHDGNTGEFIGVFASEGMRVPDALRFESNGYLLVHNFGDGVGTGFITEYDTSGSFVRTVATGLSSGANALELGSDGNLYISNWEDRSIDQYSPDGIKLAQFAKGGLDIPQGHIFGGDNNNLFVVSLGSNTVVEFDGSTGEFISTFISTHLDTPEDIVFDRDGNIWVANFDSNDINEFDGTTGAWIRRVTWFRNPLSITVKPALAECLTMSVSSLKSGKDAIWSISGATPGSSVAVVVGYEKGTTIFNGQFGYCATFNIQDINQKRRIGVVVADQNGNASLIRKVPRYGEGLFVLTQAAEQGTCPDECVSNLDIQVVQ